ncbi:MAG: hypothetical protein V3V16_09330 [Melioribacteraceae bacterium]
MKKVVLVLAVLFFMVGTISAQFQEGKHHAGPSIGLSFLGASAVQFGANYEYGMKIDDVPGLIGIGGIFRYWNYDLGFWSYTNIVIGAQGNYHFKVGDGKVDPYVGITLAYNAGTVSSDGNDYFGSLLGNSVTNGGIWFGFQGGARYWFSPNMAAHARFGVGTGSALDLGIDFKF